MTAVFFVVLFLFTVHKVRRRRRRRKATLAPLAGIDTGTRSAWRVPRRSGFHKGF